jgi:hypothetical protein
LQVSNPGKYSYRVLPSISTQKSDLRSGCHILPSPVVAFASKATTGFSVSVFPEQDERNKKQKAGKAKASEVNESNIADVFIFNSFSKTKIVIFFPTKR